MTSVLKRGGGGGEELFLSISHIYHMICKTIFEISISLIEEYAKLLLNILSHA